MAVSTQLPLTMEVSGDPLRWILSSSSDQRALDIVDGGGRWHGHGPHYSRVTRGSATFTGCGPEIVLITADESAVWSCIRSKVYAQRGTGASRGRKGITDPAPRYLWRNNMFRKLGGGLASDLIRSALDMTYVEWIKRYGTLPPERLRTEIGISAVKSRNPGYSYKCAGWIVDRVVRDKLYLWAPER